MNETIKDETEMTHEAVIGPGTQLRKARERQGLDRAKMASQLHLSQAMIAALEVDDFEHLPGPVFVQGYLRKYARLLGVNEHAIIEAYQRLFPVSEKKLHASQKREVSRELHSSYWVMRYVTWGILLILAALLFFWWQNRVELEEPIVLPAEERTESGLVAPTLVVPAAEQPAQEQEVVQPLAEPVDEAASESASASQQVVEESEQMLSEIDELLSTTDQMESIQEEAPAEPVEVEASPQVILSPPVSENVAAPPGASKRVVFQFNGSCWTEVRDREGKLRIFGELGSGNQRVLNSQFGPFSVLLGNAPEVELTIDGERFDLKPYTRGKVARFNLDPDRL